jgi:hypothetical protein
VIEPAVSALIIVGPRPQVRKRDLPTTFGTDAIGAGRDSLQRRNQLISIVQTPRCGSASRQPVRVSAIEHHPDMAFGHLQMVLSLSEHSRCTATIHVDGGSVPFRVMPTPFDPSVALVAQAFDGLGDLKSRHIQMWGGLFEHVNTPRMQLC